MAVVRSLQEDWRTVSTVGVAVKRLRDDKASGASYLYTPPSGKHAASSEGGCVVLVTTPKPVRFVEPHG